MERRLATILVADFVGSTAAMARDEEGTIVHIAACLGAVRDAAETFSGRVFSTAGDAIFAEFASPLSALRAAMQARSALAALPNGTAQDMRFALHTADVVAIEGDIRGDGVNVAARLQSGGVPGAIDLTGDTYNHIRRHSPCQFDALGPQAFKGLPEPIEVYRVRNTMNRHVFQIAPTIDRPAVRMRPNSVAVAPFATATSADEDQRFLADGLTDDLILELSRLKTLFVTSRTASHAMATRDPVELGTLLGVRYLVSGSVRKIGAKIRLNIALADTETGAILWSDRIQRPFDAVLDVLDDITARIAATVAGSVERDALAKARFKRPENMSAYEFYLRGVEQHRLGGVTDQHIHDAMAWFLRAQEADPSFGRPHSMYVCSWSCLETFDAARALEITQHAVQLDPTDPEPHRIMGAILMHLGDFGPSRAAHETALRLAPNDAYVLGRSAAFYIFAGESERALDLLAQAEELDPFLPVWIVEERIAAFYTMGRHDAVLEAARSLPHQTRRSWLYRAAARIALGDPVRARKLVARACADDPTLSMAFVRSQECYRDDGLKATLMDRLREAGLPETPDRVAATEEISG